LLLLLLLLLLLNLLNRGMLSGNARWKSRHAEPAADLTTKCWSW
jgi:hypothetical protein